MWSPQDPNNATKIRGPANVRKGPVLRTHFFRLLLDAREMHVKDIGISSWSQKNTTKSGTIAPSIHPLVPTRCEGVQYVLNY